MFPPSDAPETGFFRSKIMGSESSPNTRSRCLESLNACTDIPTREPELDSQSASGLWRDTAVGDGWSQTPDQVRCSASRFHLLTSQRSDRLNHRLPYGFWFLVSGWLRSPGFANQKPETRNKKPEI